MRLVSSAASLSRLLASQRAADQLRKMSASITTYHQEAKNDASEPSTAPESKDMNYCTAVNDALHKIMATNPKSVMSFLLFLFFNFHVASYLVIYLSIFSQIILSNI
jgi:hypothetical protein